MNLGPRYRDRLDRDAVFGLPDRRLVLWPLWLLVAFDFRYRPPDLDFRDSPDVSAWSVRELLDLFRFGRGAPVEGLRDWC